MKAITYQKYGGPEVLEVADVPEPKVAPGEVRIAVKAASINPVDWKLMQGHLDPLFAVQFPVIPGWDVAGVVEQVGIDVPEYAVGDEVIAYARKDWLSQGTWAEKVTAPVRTMARKPSSLSWEQAASLPLAGLTAYQTVHRLRVGSGDTVLVHAAAGGVGSFAVQIASALGARVIGTASERNHERVRELGAEPLAYGEGLAERVRELAPGGVDVVLDYVGGVLDTTLAVLAEGGRHTSIIDQAVLEHGAEMMWVRPDPADLAALAAMADQEKVRVDVARVYPLQEAADAVHESMEGHVSGKLALRVAE